MVLPAAHPPPLRLGLDVVRDAGHEDENERDGPATDGMNKARRQRRSRIRGLPRSRSAFRRRPGSKAKRHSACRLRVAWP
jgi:hypothetical protein